MVLSVDAWKKKAIELTNKLNTIVPEFNTVLNDWEEVRDAAGDPGKHDVDECFTKLSDARAALCALKGGSKRKHRRTRKHRR